MTTIDIRPYIERFEATRDEYDFENKIYSDLELCYEADVDEEGHAAVEFVNWYDVIYSYADIITDEYDLDNGVEHSIEEVVEINKALAYWLATRVFDYDEIKSAMLDAADTAASDDYDYKRAIGAI